MPRHCTVCHHPKREAIDVALVAGASLRDIAGQFRISKSALARHKGSHIPAALAKAKEAQEVAQADDLLAQVRQLQAKVLGILHRAEKAGESRTATDDWETIRGGGVRAVGVGGGITGRGGDLIVIDGPVKSREEANSLAYRDRVWDWWTDDIYTRLEPGGAVILIMTRWHEDDLAGRILAGPDGASWVQLILPAEAEENDPLGRQIGEPLCPERCDKAELQRIHQVLGSWSYAALYQQRPQPAEGGLAKRVWFDKIVDRAPAGGWRYRAWDLAATEKKLTLQDPDYTVGVLMVKAKGHYYVEDVVRARVGPGAVEALMLKTARLDGQGVPIHLAQDPGQAGKAQVAALVRMLSGWAVASDRPTGDKVTNAMPFLAQAEHGNVSLVRGKWNRAWIDEMCAFPVGKHDDQVDATSDAFNALSQVRPPLPRVRVRIRRG